MCQQRRGVTWNKFWSEDNNQTIWPTDWALRVVSVRRVKFMCAKYEVIRETHVEGISMFERVIFLVTVYASILMVMEQRYVLHNLLLLCKLYQVVIIIIAQLN